MMFASPAITSIAFVCYSREASITFLNVKIWTSCLSSFTIVLNSTLESFVTIWRLLSSTKADMLGEYITVVTPYCTCNTLPAYKQCLKTSIWISMRFSPRKFQPPLVMAEKHQELYSDPYCLQNHDKLTFLPHHSF